VSDAVEMDLDAQGFVSHIGRVDTLPLNFERLLDMDTTVTMTVKVFNTHFLLI